jgi:hypothetical protein
MAKAKHENEFIKWALDKNKDKVHHQSQCKLGVNHQMQSSFRLSNPSRSPFFYVSAQYFQMLFARNMSSIVEELILSNASV